MRYFGKYSMLLLLTLFVMAPHVVFADAATDGSVVTSKLYVDNTMVKKSQGAGTNNANVGKTLVVNSGGNLELSATDPELTGNKVSGNSNDTIADYSSNSTKYTSAAAVAEYAVAKAQGTGTNNANVGKTMVVNSSGNLELSATTPELTGNKVSGGSNDTIADYSSNSTKYTSAAAVAQYAVAINQGVGTSNANVGKGMVINSSGNLEVGAVRPTVSQTNTGTSGYVVDSVALDNNNPTQINVTRSYVKIPVAAGAPSSNTPSAFAEIWLQ